MIPAQVERLYVCPCKRQLSSSTLTSMTGTCNFAADHIDIVEMAESGAICTMEDGSGDSSRKP